MGSDDAAGIREAAPLRTLSKDSCPLCGRAGEQLYVELQDGVFGVPGSWGMRRCHEPACGALWLDPRPVEQDLPRAYESYYTHGAHASGGAGMSRRARARLAGALALRHGRWRDGVPWQDLAMGALLLLHPGWRAQVDMRSTCLPPPDGGRLLEVGCGGGRMLGELAALGWEVAGVETDPAAVRAARRHGFEVHTGDLASAAFPDASFDLLLLMHVIEHVPDPRGLLLECRRVLRPGGSLVVATPNAESRGHRRFGRHWRGLEPPRHLTIFGPRGLLALARETGFLDAQVRTTIRGAAGMVRASRQLERTGSCDETPRQRLAARLRWHPDQLAAWIAQLRDSGSGEELLLVAARS
jgi:2-polyprenyl-3-methyl-5-hydroxy-6-metoxy-1,4-benzoquinol methylase